MMRKMKLMLLLALAFSLAKAVPAGAASGNVVVIVDAYTGFAIDGFDPVTYFTAEHPQQGIDGFEARWGGVSWRFMNAGNRQAFLISPEIYMPQFGGYDPVALSRGVMTRGDPLVYLLYKDKVYFFFSAYAREDFLGQPQRMIRAAQQNWPKLKDGRD